MADMHILTGNVRGTSGLVDLQVAYHIPITNPKPEVTFPSIISQVSNIATEELDELKAGTLFEIMKSETYNENVSIEEQKQRLRNKWTQIKDDVNQTYPLKYKFFGVSIDVND